MELFKNIFLFDEKNPLIYSRLGFWIFYLVVLMGYSLVYKKNPIRNFYLFLISIFFYYKTGGLFFFILLFTTCTDFTLGMAIFKAEKYYFKRLWIILSITFNLGMLAFFKYDYFLTETFNRVFGTNFEVVTHAAKWSNALFSTHFDLARILPPIGVSFFTFQSISYVVDIYRGKLKPVRNLIDFGFYVSFFPQLVSGPIVRATEFIPQIYKKYELSLYEFGDAIFLILQGLTKKILIGDYIAINLIDRVFSNPASFTGFENLAALVGYSLQVYCDFSGYTDIATGVALLMGFHLPKNFNSPYKAKNVGDFWKRWHMSLSSWLKDYLYIPMGGNRKSSAFTYISLAILLLFVVFIAGKLILIPVFLFIISFFWLLAELFPSFKLKISTNINLLITMFLGGLWHGASWMFVIWGVLNGIGLIIYKFWKKISPYEHSNLWIINVWRIMLTFTFITFTRIWFRSESMQNSFDLLKQISSDFGWPLIADMVNNYWKVFLIIIVGLIIHWLPGSLKIRYREWFINRPIYQQIIVSVVVIFTVYQSATAGLQPFIYFQF
jgi:alginate O-acetyltransferase complex protein AlgI